MRGSRNIVHRPYLPPTRKKELQAPYICRLAPSDEAIEFEWFDHGCNGSHTVYIGKRDQTEKTAHALIDRVTVISGLDDCTEYEFYIEAENGARSKTRFFRTGAIPDGCTVINYLHPDDKYYDLSGRFLCSPSIVRTKSGRLIAGMDVFAPLKAQNLTLMYYSDDDGKNWRYLCDLYPFYWGSLFEWNGVVYLLGLTTEYGNLQITCTYDDGNTWAEPVTLFYGSSFPCPYGGMHRTPMQIVPYNGKLYTTCEYGSWGCIYLPAVLSIDEDADLMIPENWVMSDTLPFDGEWAASTDKKYDTIEGNIVPLPDGKLYNFMRWKVGEMLKLRVNTEDPEAPLQFVGIVKAPVSDSMFKIIPDGERYLLLTNHVTEKAAQYGCETNRNVLSIFETCDLEHFTWVKDIFNREDEHPDKNGFQYPAYLYENGRFTLSVRSAFNEPNSAHDSNYILFCHATFTEEKE